MKRSSTVEKSELMELSQDISVAESRQLTKDQVLQRLVADGVC